MISTLMKSPYGVMKEIAKRARDKRLGLNLRQQTLAQKSGVSYGTLKKFERSGQISLESLLKIALTLNELESFEYLFAQNEETLPTSIDQLLIDKSRKRGRK